ncbi:MAG: penicillin acylase family protein [Bryobacteraceae bacterium]|jgi:penicillin amidase
MTHSAVARIVRYVNIAIAIALTAALALVYWYAWRPLAQRSGAVTAPVSAAVAVSFDARGVPHIRAGALEDALFVQGYVTAQDRLFQMDGLRRAAAGELAEVLGPAYLDADRDARRLRMRRIAESAYASLPPHDRAALAAYARGVNDFLATHRARLPLEFTLLAYQPRPWSVVDSILVCLYMYRDLTNSWRDELSKRTMLAAGDKRKVEFLFPVGAGAGPQPGSNAWAVAGSRTASGKPLLSNDIHLEYSIPGIWYMAHLQAPGLDVAGVALPGLPGVISGHNRRIAWGVTNLEFDAQDLYIEKFDDRTGRYEYRGQIEQARAEREFIRVKGQAPAEQIVWVTRHGPVFASEGATRMALRWVAAEPVVWQYPILDIDRAQNWGEFTAALARFPGPGQNFVYADVDGNIGSHAAGKLPIRRGYRGDVPVDGSSGDFDWEGFIPFEQLPATFNPPSGIVASANQDVFPADYRYPVNGAFDPAFRARQIENRLAARNNWRAEDLLAVQNDIYSAFDKFFAGQLVAAYDRRDARNSALDPAVDLLRRWNGQMDKNQAAPFLVALAYQYVRTAAAESAAPASGPRYEFSLAAVAIERLLRERPAGWFLDYDGMLLRALADAVEEGRRMQGPDPQRWQYGAYSRISVRNPVVHQLPLVGPYFDLGPVPMSGSGRTIRQFARGLAPSMRMDADLAEWDRSLLNIQIGQSGQALSSHYRDEWDAWYNARSFPMQFRKIEPSSVLEFRPN